MLVSRFGVSLALFVFAKIVVMGGLMVMMSGRVMMGGGSMMMLARRMLRLSHGVYSTVMTK